jgi:hypothetical protein
LVLKKVALKFEPMILAITEEREAIFNTLKDQFEELQAMANDTALPKKMRLRAMGLAVRVAEAMEGVLKDAYQDKLLADIAETKEMLAKSQRNKQRKKGRYKWGPGGGQ